MAAHDPTRLGITATARLWLVRHAHVDTDRLCSTYDAPLSLRGRADVSRLLQQGTDLTAVRTLRRRRMDPLYLVLYWLPRLLE